MVLLASTYGVTGVNVRTSVCLVHLSSQKKMTTSQRLAKSFAEMSAGRPVSEHLHWWERDSGQLGELVCVLITFGLVYVLLCAPHFQSLRATEHLRSSGQRMRAQQFVESSTHQGPWVPPPGKSTRSTMTWKVRTYICTYVCIRSLCSYSVWAGGYVHTHEHTYVHTCVGCVVSAESLPSPGDQPSRGGWRHSADCGRPGQQWVRKCQDCGSEWMCNDQLTYVHLCILTLFVRVCHAVKASSDYPGPVKQSSAF